MSMIDCFKNEIIGFSKNGVPLYRLLQNIPAHIEDFQGKTGDILLGGGGGETSAIRFSMPECITFFTDFENSFPRKLDFFGDIVKPYLSLTEGYIYGKEYAKLGWNSDETPLETWLAENLVAFIIKTDMDYYKKVIGPDIDLDCDGSIFSRKEV